MRILLVGNYKADAQQSMQRYAATLQFGLERTGQQVRVIRPDGAAGKLAKGKWLGYIDKFVLFPATLRNAAEWADLVHICDHSNSMYTRFIGSRPHLVTCHDMLAIRSAHGDFQSNPTRLTGRCLQRIILNGIRSAQHVACVSEATRKDVQHIAGLPPERLSVIHNGLNYPYSPMSSEEAKRRLDNAGIDADKRFILHVGGNQWYKNRFGVLRIFAALRKLPGTADMTLIMVGKQWTPQMRRFVFEQQLHESITELVGVENEDLRALYSRASALLFPSLQEGFGWPIIEAQACGCPVVASNRPPMSEIGAEAACYIDPDDCESSARELLRVLNSPTTYRQLGLRNAARFNEFQMIRSYLALYEQVIQQARPARTPEPLKASPELQCHP